MFSYLRWPKGCFFLWKWFLLAIYVIVGKNTSTRPVFRKKSGETGAYAGA